MAIYQYARVSTRNQKADRQEYVLEQQGIRVDKVYIDKISGKKEFTEKRPSLNQLKLDVVEGDLIYIESISRLARDLKDAIEICEYFIEKKVRVKILKEGIDTNNEGTYKLLVGIFGAIAEMERVTIVGRSCERTKQLKEIYEETGVIETKSGKWYGREKTTKESILNKYPKFERYLKQTKEGIITKGEMAKMLGIGRTCLYKYLAIYEGRE